MIQQRWCPALLALVACGGGGSASSVAPANSAAGAVESFMQAVADSNLPRMAELWGTASGPAARTGQPSDWERRILIMQSYLRNESHRVLPAAPAAEPGRQDLQVEIRRELCTWKVPFTAVQTSSGWLVNQVDLTAAGNPARPCVPGQMQDSAAQQQDSPAQQQDSLEQQQE